MPSTTSGLETEWDYSGRKERDGQKKKIGKANERKGKVKRGKDEEVNGQGGIGVPRPHTGKSGCHDIVDKNNAEKEVQSSCVIYTEYWKRKTQYFPIVSLFNYYYYYLSKDSLKFCSSKVLMRFKIKLEKKQLQCIATRCPPNATQVVLRC